MSRTAPLEVCARCEMFKPSTEMTNVYVRDVNGQVVCLRLCRSCRHPVLTYITAPHRPAVPLTDNSRLLMVALALVLVVLNVIFGLILGAPIGLAVALSGILVGAGVLVAVATSCIQQSS